MGNTQISAPQPDLTDITFDMKMKSKRLEKQADKMERQIETEKLKVKKAMEKGDMETAKVFAQNAIRKKAERTNMYRLAARIDACSSQIQTAARTQNIGNMMGKVVQGLDISMEKMDVDQLTLVMDKFETQMENLNVVGEYQNQALQSSSAHLEKPMEVEALMKEVAAEHSLELEDEMLGIGGSSQIGTTSQVSVSQPSDELALQEGF